MAISVAPLTTTVMGAVDQGRAGIASGVNNAVSRVAGLLAVAAFGLVLSLAFGRSLDDRLNRLPLTPEARNHIDAQRASLAGARTADPQVQRAIQEAFIDGYRLVLAIAVALSLSSAASASSSSAVDAVAPMRPYSIPRNVRRDRKPASIAPRPYVRIAPAAILAVGDPIRRPRMDDRKVAHQPHVDVVRLKTGNRHGTRGLDEERRAIEQRARRAASRGNPRRGSPRIV